MARPGLRSRLGTQPTQTTIPTRGRGRGGGAYGVQAGPARPRNRPNRPNQGGGRGIPKGGTYGGRAGEALTNTDPESYIISMFQNAGLFQNPATQQATWMRDEAIRNLMAEYAGAAGTNQNLSVEDFFRKNYGVEYGGKKGTRFNPGTLSQLTGTMAEKWRNYEGETQPLSVATRHMGGGGWVAGGGGAGSQDFQNWFQESFAPGLKTQHTAFAQANAPQMSFDQFLQGQDVLGKARKAWAYRSPLLRSPAPIDFAGRYSWWE